MRFLRRKLDQPAGLTAAMVAAGVLTGGVTSCRGREAPEDARGGNVEFKVGGLSATYLRTLVVVQDRLWVTTNGGIAVIDPVTETWTIPVLGSNHLEGASVIPCGSDVWLLLRDGVALVNLQRRTFQVRSAREDVPVPLGALAGAFCGPDGLWFYVGKDSALFRIPASGTATEKYSTRGPGRSLRGFGFVESLQRGIYFLAPQYNPAYPPDAGLFRFDPNTSKLDRVELPGQALPIALERTDDGLLVRTRDARVFLLKVDRQPWVEAPTTYSEPVLAVGDSVVWVGASYDVSPTSYFVLRYIRDVREPKDLVILTRGPLGVRHGGAVHYLGMLWAVSESKILRIDPNAEELVSYALTDSSGRLAKKSFRLMREGRKLMYFDGDTLRHFSDSLKTPDSTGAEPESPDSADLGKKPERQLLLDSDFLTVELQVLRRVREVQHAHELSLGLAVVALRAEELAERE